MSRPATTVWCASYPKSGNTWMRALLAGVTGDGEVSLSHLVGGSGTADQAFVLEEVGVNPSQLDDADSFALMRESASSVAERPDGQIFRKTHERFIDDPHAGQGHVLSTPARAIYITRDPRAIVPSLAWHLNVSQPEAARIMGMRPEGLLEGQVGEMLGDEVRELMGRYLLRGAKVPLDWGDWSTNVNSWLDQDAVPVTLVRYEDLIADPHAELERVAREIGLEVAPEVLERSVESSSFQSLSVQEMLVGFQEAAAPERPFFRRGEPESWREELEPGVGEKICSAHGAAMARLGYADG